MEPTGGCDDSDAGPPVSGAALDPERLATLFVEFGAELRRFVLGIVRDPEVAEDVVQSAFARAVEQGHTARPETFKGWLFRVAWNEALTARRRQQVRDKGRERLAALWSSAVDEPPEGRLVRGETVEAVREVLGRLPAEQQRVVRARMYEDKTFAEIASEQGIPLGTVLTRMRLAMGKLRRALDRGG